MKIPKPRIPYLAGILCLAAALPLHAELLVYEPFNYGVAGADRVGSDLFNGQPDGSGGDVDAVGLGGTWVDATNNNSGASFLSAGSLSFGNFSTIGNHVRSDTNSNSDRFHRPITAGLAGGNGELWISFLANKLQNNFDAAREGIAITNGILNDARFDQVSPTGLQGFGIAPINNGTAWTAYGWDGTTAVAGGENLPVATNGSQTVLLVGQIEYDAGTGGADIFTLHHYTLNAGEMTGGQLVEITSIEVNADQSLLNTLNLTRQVNTAFDEIRIGTSLNDVLGLATPELVGTNPINGAADVPVFADLEAFFNKNMTLTGIGSITLRNLTLGSGADVVINLPDSRVSVSDTTLTISPDTNFDDNTAYAVQISADAVADQLDIPFGGILDDTTWTFTTGAADTTPPVVASLSPTEGATFVAASAQLAATFDKEIVLGSGDIRIKNLSTSSQTVITVPDPQVSLSGDTLTITPSTSLDAGADYEVEIDGSVVVDLFGNLFEGLPNAEVSWTFTTGVPPAGLLVYEGFQYEEPGDGLQGQPTDPSGTDTDATGITGVWTDAEASLPDNRLILKEGSLSFGDLVVSGNHVGSSSNANQDRFHRSFTSDAQLGIAGNSEIWFSFLAEKPQNDNSQAREGVAITNQVIGDPRLVENNGSDGLIGFGVGPTTAGNNWTAYAWNGSSRISGTAALNVGIGVGDARLLVGHVSYDSGPGGTDEFTLYEYQLGPDGIIEGGALSQIGDTIQADVNQSALTTLNVTRRVNTNYDEIRIGTSFEDVVPALTYEDWAALFPGTDLSDPNADFDGDSLTNLQEFELRSNPTLPDTDGDSLLDGGNLAVTDADTRYNDFAALGIAFTDDGGTRTFIGEATFGTNPDNIDTDGDGLIDGDSITLADTDPRYTEWASMGLVFTEDAGLRTFIGELAVGSNPLVRDTDTDGLPDGEEVALGTNPLNPDTDGDGVGDWYEVHASFTNPLDANDKPVVPYPLPAHDGSPGATDKPVKVYIMSGQSNMVGFGTVSGTEDHTLETMTLRQNKFPNLIDEMGGWTTRPDVRYRGVISDFANAQLSPGALGATFGPELGFGYIMGWHHDEPVLLLKSCTGNRSLGWDILPPGSPSYVYDGTNYAGYGDFGNWPVGEDPPPPGDWYGGKEFDRFFKDEADWAHDFPADFNVVDVLDNFATEYPDWAGQGFEIAGFVWWQGDKDRYDLGYATRYEQNLVGLINSLRDYYTNRYPGKVANNAPFVLATLGQTTLDSTNTADKAILDAQLAVDGDTGNYPQFSGNVKTVYSHPLSAGGASNGHYNGHAATYMLVGDALGRAMVEVLGGTTPPPPAEGAFADWSGLFPGLTDTDPTLDFDGGGLATALEWVLGGNPTDPADDMTILPTLDTDSDPDGKMVFTFRRRADANADPDTTILVEYGSDLAGWTAAAHQGAGAEQITITETPDGFGAGIDSVTVAIPATLAGDGKLFARLNVAVVMAME